MADAQPLLAVEKRQLEQTLNNGDRATLEENSDRTLRVWDVATQQCLRVIEGHTGVIIAVIFLNDAAPGRQHPLVASGSLDETIRLWDIETGECLEILRPDRLYEAMNIAGISGLSPGEIATLKSLGAVEG